MTLRDNPNDSEIPRIKERLHILETQSPIGFSSITRGALRVASPEGLLVEGSAYVSGILHGDGTFNWSGDMNLTGSQHVTGPTVFDGTLTINGNTTVNGPFNVVGTWKLIGNGEVQGNVTVTGDIDVNSPGRIRITGGSSPATLENGAMTFGTGGKVEADIAHGGVRMVAGINGVYAGTNAAIIQYGSVSIILSGSGISMFGLATTSSSLANNAPVGCIWTDGTGKLFEVV